MIIKICEEMRQVRLDSDYMNYRTLVNILRDYAHSDLFNAVYIYRDATLPKEYMVIVDKIKVLDKWISSEIDHMNELLEINLKKKDYKNFKMLSQSDVILKSIHNRIEELRSRCLI